MRSRVLARKSHKWIALFVGLQVVVWSLSGLYMTAIHIDIIHGDHLIREAPQRAADISGLRDPLAVAAAYRATGARLAWVEDRPAYALATEGGETVVDAASGRPLAKPGEADIRAIARASYTGTEKIASAKLMSEVPGEIRGRKPPLWRVEFDHWNKPTLYFSAATGELVTRRHELWRIFDFMWMLHIMDYDERDNVNNLLLRVFCLASVALTLTGAWLLLFSFPQRKRKAQGK